MDPTDDFAAAFDAAFSAFGTLGSFGGIAPPTSEADTLNLTVGEYLSLLDLAEQSLASFNSTYFSTLLNNPQLSGALDAQTRAMFETFASGDFSLITAPLDTVRAALAPYSPDTPLLNIYEGLGGGTSEEIAAQVQAAFAAAQAELVGLLWNDQNGIFNSPIFTIDPDTGSWFAQNAGGQSAYSGTGLDTFFAQLGEAVSGAIMSLIGTRDSVVAQLLDQGATADTFAQAQTAAEAAASQAFAALQDLAGQLAEGGTADPATVEADVTARFGELVAAFTTLLPQAAETFNSFIAGSRNSDPSFIVSLDGNVSGSEEGDWFYLSAQNDSFDGGIGADVLFGMGGDDNLMGGADDDNLFGGVGNDTMTGGTGDDGINGGEGSGDTAVFGGDMGTYTLQFASTGVVTAQDRSADGEGTDVLTGVEMLSFGGGASIFTDGTIDLTRFQGIAGLSEEDISTFIELYIAYFNRAPDAIGLNFWGTAFATGTSLEEIASLFLDQDETRATYPADASNLDFATQVYSNVLGRTPDAAGLAFWEGQLNSGSVSRGAFILEVLKGAKADPEPGASQEFIDLQNGDRAYLSDKTDIGTYYAVIKGLSDVTDASDAMGLYMRGAEASIQSAVDKIDQDYTDALAAGSDTVLMQLVGVADDPFAV